MTITTRFDDEIELTQDEQHLLDATLSLLKSKDSNFREAFIHAITDEFCQNCGSDMGGSCYCTRDD